MNTISKCTFVAVLASAVLFTSACSNSSSSIFAPTLQGQYLPLHRSTVAMEVVFKPEHKANYRIGALGLSGPMTEVDYEVRGKEVLLQTSQGVHLVGTISDDGCLDFSTYGKLCKQTDASLTPAGTSGNAPPPYIFNGAYATYRTSVGDALIPFTMTISEVDLARQTCKTSVVYEGSFSKYSKSSTGHFRFSALTPSDSNLVHSGRVPGEKVRHNVAVLVPAGTFSTEEISSKEISSSKEHLWIDAKSGLWIKVVGPNLPSHVGIKASGTTELMKTNVPTTLSE